MSIKANAAISGSCGDNLNWILDDDGTLTISGKGTMTNYDEMSIPFYPFQNNADIKKIIIGDSVTSIGSGAFTNTNKSFIIKGYSGSYAETYAKRKLITFEAIGTTQQITTTATTTNKLTTTTTTEMPYSITTSYENRLEIVKLPDKTEFSIGEMYDLSGGLVRYKVINHCYDNGGYVVVKESENIEMISEDLDLTTDYNPNIKGKYTINLQYKKPYYYNEYSMPKASFCVNVVSSAVATIKTTTSASTAATTTTSTTTNIGEENELSLSETEIFIKAGEKHPLKANQSNLTYKSSNEDIAVVSNKGIITGISKGTVVITVINQFKDTASITVNVVEPNYGDTNCDNDVDISDAVLIMQSLSNPSKYNLTDLAKVNADCCNVGDGVTNADALAIQKYKLSLITELPEKK